MMSCYWKSQPVVDWTAHFDAVFICLGFPKLQEKMKKISENNSQIVRFFILISIIDIVTVNRRCYQHNKKEIWLLKFSKALHVVMVKTRVRKSRHEVWLVFSQSLNKAIQFCTTREQKQIGRWRPSAISFAPVNIWSHLQPAQVVRSAPDQAN